MRLPVGGPEALRYGILRRNALLFPKSLKPAFGATVWAAWDDGQGAARRDHDDAWLRVIELRTDPHGVRTSPAADGDCHQQRGGSPRHKQ